MHRMTSAMTALAVASAVTFVAAPADATSRYAVTVAVSASSVGVGQTVTLAGTVSPKAAGERVKVQRLAGAAWTTVARTRLNRHSRYSVPVAVAAPGDNTLRVVMPKSDGHKKGVSATVTVVGWRWRPIAGLPTVGEVSKTTALATGILGGQPYSPFIVQADPTAYTASATYALEGKCTWLDLHVGGTVDSANTTASYAYLDATYLPSSSGPGNLFSGPVSKDSDPIHVVRGPNIVPSLATITLFSSHDTGDGVGWGAAKAYCRS